mgnify:CR=1 FL=1
MERTEAVTGGSIRPAAAHGARRSPRRSARGKRAPRLLFLALSALTLVSPLRAPAARAERTLDAREAEALVRAR